MGILGVDIGGTKIKIIVTDATNKRKVFSFGIKTARNKRRLLKILAETSASILQKFKISGIGIGAPGIVDSKKGILAHSPNLPFLNRWNIKRFFRRFKMPVKIDNDSRCFLRAEAVMGSGKGKKYIAVLNIGTGIGGGLLLDGRVYFGARSGAGEFGHMIVNQGKTLEQLAGKKAFLKYGDRSEILGIGVANIVNAFDPEIVILGGGAVYQKKINFQKVRAIARKFIMSPSGKKTPIVAGKIGEYAGALGAVLLFRK